MDHVERIEDGRLALGRPELREVLHRYVSPTALLVGRSPARLESLRSEFSAHGWDVKECAGPGRTRCPILQGRECRLRDSADVAVVYLRPGTNPEIASSPRVMCAAQHGAPVVVAIESSIQPPRIAGDQAVLGALRTPGQIREVAEALVEDRARGQA